MYNRLLSAPFPLVLTQSFTFLSKAASQGLLQRQFHRLGNAGDFAVSQTAELKDALDALTSNEFVMADHHFCLQVLADIDAHSGHGGDGPRTAQSSERSCGAGAQSPGRHWNDGSPEDLALEAAFWAQLPGNFAMRPRKAPLRPATLRQ